MRLNRTADQEISPIYRRLEREEFQNRMVASFPAIYLMNVSIVQAVALGILAERTFGYVAGLESRQFALWAPLIPYAVMSFAVIVLTSFEYHWFVGMYQWSPKALDTIAPYILGVAEIGPIFFLTSHRVWWFLSVAVPLVAIAVYLNTLANCRDDMFLSREIYDQSKRNIVEDIVLSCATAGAGIVIGVFYPRLVALPVLSRTIASCPVADLLLCVGFLAGAASLMRKEHRFLSAMHDRMGFRY